MFLRTQGKGDARFPPERLALRPAPVFQSGWGRARPAPAARVTTAGSHRRGRSESRRRRGPAPAPAPLRPGPARPDSAQRSAQPRRGRAPPPHTRGDPRCLARRPPPGNSAAAGASSHWSLSVTPSRLLCAARAAIGCCRLSVGEGEPRWCPGCALVRRALLPGAAAAGAAAGGAVMPAAGRRTAAGARHGAACAQAGEGGERGR